MSIAYRILRYVNSVAFGPRKKITSIREAIVYLGVDLVRKWTFIWALAGLGQDKPTELVVSSVIRGICCERLAPKIRLGNRASELFLLGMFSMIDAIMDRPMDEVFSSINLPRDVHAGLVPGEGPLRSVLDLTVAFERGDWTACARGTGELGIADEDIASTYHEASRWANDVFAVA